MHSTLKLGDYDKFEPDVLIELADAELDWAVLLILVGEGQEINNGENAGLTQWNTALNKSQNNWEVVCPDKLAGIFEDNHIVIANDNLNLNMTLRSYLCSNVSKFVNLIIEGDINGAKSLSNSILYYRGKIVGGIYDDRLLVKPVKSAIALMPEASYELPYEGAKEMLLVDDIDNKDFLAQLFNAMYDELPSPKKKKGYHFRVEGTAGGQAHKCSSGTD